MFPRAQTPLVLASLILCLLTSANSFSTMAFTRRLLLSTASSRVTLNRFQTFSMSSSSSNNPTTIVDVCRDKIKVALQTDQVIVTGAHDDPNGSHISVQVVSTLFAGKRPVQRQQMVYKALWDELKGPVHAVDSMICKTPDE
jgi:acid stress-induced BolA-like protein IbaG/YrbA